MANKNSLFGFLKALFSSPSSSRRDRDDDDDLFDDDRPRSRFSPKAGYDPDNKRWRVVGTNYEDRERYIIDNRYDIECGVSFSREIAIDKDPNAIAVLHNEKVLGFFAKEYAEILAPVFDKHGDKIRHSVSLWINQDDELIGLYIRLHTRFKVSRDEFKAAVDKCTEIANRSIE